eukprot:497213-Pyramimonas_sp.AAC.1
MIGPWRWLHLRLQVGPCNLFDAGTACFTFGFLWICRSLDAPSLDSPPTFQLPPNHGPSRPSPELAAMNQAQVSWKRGHDDDDTYTQYTYIRYSASRQARMNCFTGRI